MSVALFITEQFMKDNTAIDGNVDPKYLNVTINDAQRLHILPILGTALFNEISDQIEAGTLTPATVSANATLLKDYIQDALKYWVLVDGMDVLHYKITNKGIVTKSSDNSQPIEQIDVIRLMDANRDKAEYFSQRITDFLIANSATYPLYYNPGSSYDTVHPKRNNYTSGLNLDDSYNTYGLPVDKGDCCNG